MKSGDAESRAHRDEKLRLIRKQFGIGGIGWIQYRESYEAAYDAGRSSLVEAIRAKLRELADEEGYIDLTIHGVLSELDTVVGARSEIGKQP